MKKAAALFLALIFVLSMVSCREDSSVSVISKSDADNDKFNFLEEREGGDEDVDTTDENAEASAEQDSIVYVTESGTKYHRATCHHLNKSKTEMTLEEAEKEGYTPCKVCFK